MALSFGCYGRRGHGPVPRCRSDDLSTLVGHFTLCTMRNYEIHSEEGGGRKREDTYALDCLGLSYRYMLVFVDGAQVLEDITYAFDLNGGVLSVGSSIDVSNSGYRFFNGHFAEIRIHHVGELFENTTTSLSLSQLHTSKGCFGRFVLLLPRFSLNN